jgi:NTP pyrophosphatase (non-canonical NTP hydrolase)
MNYLKTLSKEIHEVAKSKGWWDVCYKRISPLAPELETTVLATKLALVHAEVSEAIEELRSNRRALRIVKGKPEGLETELADIVIKVLDLAEYLGFDLTTAIKLKLEYRKRRKIKRVKKIF